MGRSGGTYTRTNGTFTRFDGLDSKIEMLELRLPPAITIHDQDIAECDNGINCRRGKLRLLLTFPMSGIGMRDVVMVRPGTDYCTLKQYQDGYTHLGDRSGGSGAAYIVPNSSDYGICGGTIYRFRAHAANALQQLQR